MSIDFDHGKATGKINGSAAGIAAAQEAINDVALSVQEDHHVSDPLRLTLLVNRAALLQQLMGEYNVRIDAPKDTKTLKLQGRPEKLLLLKQKLSELETRVTSQQLAVEKRMVATIVSVCVCVCVNVCISV